MIIDRHDCIQTLIEMQNNGIDTEKELAEYIQDDSVIPSCVIDYLRENNNSIIAFYDRLNNKSHKIIKELFDSNSDTTTKVQCVKLATSIITQAMIMMEHEMRDDVEKQNEFMKNIGIKSLSKGLCDYFNSNNAFGLIEAIQSNRRDIKNIYG